jgi:hypothetical protein
MEGKACLPKDKYTKEVMENKHKEKPGDSKTVYYYRLAYCSGDESKSSARVHKGRAISSN